MECQFDAVTDFASVSSNKVEDRLEKNILIPEKEKNDEKTKELLMDKEDKERIKQWLKDTWADECNETSIYIDGELDHTVTVYLADTQSLHVRSVDDPDDTWLIPYCDFESASNDNGEVSAEELQEFFENRVREQLGDPKEHRGAWLALNFRKVKQAKFTQTHGIEKETDEAITAFTPDCIYFANEFDYCLEDDFIIESKNFPTFTHVNQSDFKGWTYGDIYGAPTELGSPCSEKALPEEKLLYYHSPRLADFNPIEEIFVPLRKAMILETPTVIEKDNKQVMGKIIDLDWYSVSIAPGISPVIIINLRDHNYAKCIRSIAGAAIPFCITNEQIQLYKDYVDINSKNILIWDKFLRELGDLLNKSTDTSIPTSVLLDCSATNVLSNATYASASNRINVSYPNDTIAKPFTNNNNFNDKKEESIMSIITTEKAQKQNFFTKMSKSLGASIGPIADTELKVGATLNGKTAILVDDRYLAATVSGDYVGLEEIPEGFMMDTPAFVVPAPLEAIVPGDFILNQNNKVMLVIKIKNNQIQGLDLSTQNVVKAVPIGHMFMGAVKIIRKIMVVNIMQQINGTNQNSMNPFMGMMLMQKMGGSSEGGGMFGGMEDMFAMSMVQQMFSGNGQTNPFGNMFNPVISVNKETEEVVTPTAPAPEQPAQSVPANQDALANALAAIAGTLQKMDAKLDSLPVSAPAPKKPAPKKVETEDIKQ